MQRIEKVWASAKVKISEQKLGKGEFYYVRLDDSSVVPSFCGSDESERLILAFRTSKRPSIQDLKSSAFDSFVSKKQDGSWMYVLRLLDPKVESVFETLCKDLVAEVAETKNETEFHQLLKCRVDAWKRLFTQSKEGLLSRSQIIGLIGELSVLLTLVKQGYCTASAALIAWQGPYGSNQDFIFAEQAIEVKTIRDDIQHIGITSLDQLDITRFPLIHLAVNFYKDAAPNPDYLTKSLNDMVSEVFELVSSDPSDLRLLKASLLEAGYVYQEQYDSPRIALIRTDSYIVNENFPKLIPSRVPIGISKAEYSVSLDSIASFAVEGLLDGNT